MAGDRKLRISPRGHGGGGRGWQRLMAKASSRLPWMKFFVGDWIASTGGLPSEAKGLWTDLLCFCFDNSRARGTLKKDLRSMARMCGLSVPHLRRGLKQLADQDLAEVSIRGSQVAVVCRRMVREEQERRGGKCRQRKHRNTKSATRNPPAAVTPLSQTEARGQRLEVNCNKKEPKEGFLAAPAGPAPSRRAAALPAAVPQKADVGSCLENLPGGANNSGPPGAGGASSERPANGPPRERAGDMAPLSETPPGARPSPAPPRRPLFPPGWPPGPENQPSAGVWALARKLHIPPAVLAAEIASGSRPALAVAWLLVTDRRAPHDPKCGGALAWFLAHCKGAAEPPQWALLDAVVILRTQKLLMLPRAELRGMLLKNSPHAEVVA